MRRQLLSNPAGAAAGGFRYDVAFMCDGTDSTSFGHVETIVDYAGTESNERALLRYIPQTS